MHASDNCLKLIQAFEGILDGDKRTPNYEPYIDAAGIYTVGWGHALFTPAGSPVDVDVFGAARAAVLARAAMMHKFGKYALTLTECNTLFAEDIMKFEGGMQTRVAVDTTQAQFDALISFAFNVGLGNFDTSSVKRLHNANHRATGYVSIPDLCAKAKAKAAPISMAVAFVRWCTANGHFMLGLFRRRVAEFLLYSGMSEMQAYNTATAFHD